MTAEEFKKNRNVFEIRILAGIENGKYTRLDEDKFLSDFANSQLQDPEVREKIFQEELAKRMPSDTDITIESGADFITNSEPDTIDQAEWAGFYEGAKWLKELLTKTE